MQRINLTTALGTPWSTPLFVLDEPSIGLHPRDMDRINVAMQRLVDAGNTLVVVEHDPAVMLAADRIIDLGPGPGHQGSHRVRWHARRPETCRDLTALTWAPAAPLVWASGRPVEDNTPKLILQGARQHNLKNLNIEFPCNVWSGNGVSGSASPR